MSDLQDDYSETAEELVAQGVEHARTYQVFRDSDSVRGLTVALSKLRARHVDKRGRPDMAGRSQAYRDDVSAIYRRAGIPRDEIKGVHAAIRYHLSETLRAYSRANGFTQRDFEYYGISPESQRERTAQRRKAQNGSSVDLGSLRTASRSVHAASTPESLAVLAELPEPSRGELVVLVDEMSRALRRVRDALT